MKILFATLIICSLTAFRTGQERTIIDFANTQLDDYQIDQTKIAQYFVNTINNQNLHNNHLEVSIKAKKSHSNKNSYNKSVYSRIQIWQFDFETNDKCEQAIDSLLNCFPNDCAKIKRQKNQGIKINPSIWIFTGKKIFVARIPCEQVDEKWSKFKKDFIEIFAETGKEIIVTECGKLTWTTKEEINNTH